MGSIYLIKNNRNYKYYVGQTHQDVHRRFWCHIWEAERQVDETKLNRAIRKYGRESFYYSILKICSTRDLDFYEQKYIRVFNSFENGYNSTIGGNSGGSGPRSQETKNKIRKFQQKYNQLDAVRQQMTGSKHHQFNKLGQKSKNFGIIRQKTLDKIPMIVQIRYERYNGIKASDLCKKYNVCRKTIDNYCGIDYEKYGGPTTTKNSVKQQSMNRTLKTMRLRDLTASVSSNK